MRFPDSYSLISSSINSIMNSKRLSKAFLKYAYKNSMDILSEHAYEYILCNGQAKCMKRAQLYRNIIGTYIYIKGCEMRTDYKIQILNKLISMIGFIYVIYNEDRDFGKPIEEVARYYDRLYTLDDYAVGFGIVEEMVGIKRYIIFNDIKNFRNTKLNEYDDDMFVESISGNVVGLETNEYMCSGIILEENDSDRFAYYNTLTGFVYSTDYIRQMNASMINKYYTPKVYHLQKRSEVKKCCCKWW